MMTLQDLIKEYLYFKRGFLENDLTALHNRSWWRYRKLDELDYLEFIIAKVRFNMYNEIADDIYKIFNMEKH